MGTATDTVMSERLGVRNPRTGEVDHWVCAPASDLLADQCCGMREAQVIWREAGLQRRIEILQAWKQALNSERAAIIESLATDTGRWPESVLEFDGVVSTIDRWCRIAPGLLAETEERSTAIPFIHVNSSLVPHALVGVISPWNFPLLLSTIDTIPALLAGCAVVVKPSEVAPRFVQPMSRAISAVPGLRDVLAYMEGAGETGAQVIDNVDVICFTGSVETGRKVAEAAARRFIPAFLELGGKDPAIVLASANLELATSALLWASVVNAGQSCLSIERIYVAQPIFDESVGMLVEKAERLRLAYPEFESGEIGPLIDENQANVIQSHLEDATSKGARVRCGGSIEHYGGGLWCRPIVLTNVNHGMKIMTEETFGPIMPVMPFATADEAVRLANDTKYGLSAAVFAHPEQEARGIARRLQAGAVSINDAGLTAVIHEGEKTAFKLSGLGGTRMGPASIRRFVRTQAHLIKKDESCDPWWFGGGTK